jgi:acyl-phosphate glycerol 3-phosphate acyltransferase
MTTPLLLCLVALAAYLVGALPFGYLIARARGVNILREGSGNIGATNVGRILGLRWGVLVFLLDFAKGAGPVLIASQLPQPDLNWSNVLPVLAGISAFVGHLFPVYLGFRGGKGVATGAGVMIVLVQPWIITLVVLVAWAIVLVSTRYMSLASLTAAVLLLVLRLVLTREPWGNDEIVITLFCVLGSALVILRHQSNIRRLVAGTEHRLWGSP